jgi:hypothetical protein
MDREEILSEGDPREVEMMKVLVATEVEDSRRN